MVAWMVGAPPATALTRPGFAEPTAPTVAKAVFELDHTVTASP
jgi:hypothetical protein